MRNFFLDICDVEKIIKDRFKVTPARIEPYNNKVLFNLNAVAIQNKTYTWRFDKPVQESGAVANTLDFPFFVGKVDFQAWNDTALAANVSGFYVVVSGFNLDSIGTFYNTTSEQWKSYGDGVTFVRPLPPDQGSNETSEKLNNPHDIVAPYMSVQVFVDATGAVFLQMSASFEGFRVYMS